MLNRHPFRPDVERLEPRLALATYPAGFIGPLPPGGHLAAAFVNTMAITPTAPNLGQPFSATITIATPANTTMTGTTWTYEVSYGGYDTPAVSVPGGYLSATFYGGFPGEYTITSTSTFKPMDPQAPPVVVKIDATVNVAVPTTAVNTYGTGVSTDIGTAIMTRDTVSTALGKIGPDTPAMAQENIAAFFFYNGDIMAGLNGWYPGAPSAQFYLNNGQIYDAIGLDVAYWVGTPIGATYVSWSQQLRLTWMLTGWDSGGNWGNYTMSAGLTTLNWDVVKVSATDWELES
jgi:hypothetical protein